MNMANVITAEDMARLESAPALVKESSIERFGTRHHTLAQYIALGETLERAAIIAGYSLPAARAVEGDPSFKDLVHFYLQDTPEYQKLMAFKQQGISMSSIDELAQRLEDPERVAKMSDGFLLKLVEAFGDRNGMAIVQKSEQTLNVGISARLESARKRTLTKVIEHEPKDVTPA